MSGVHALKATSVKCWGKQRANKMVAILTSSLQFDIRKLSPTSPFLTDVALTDLKPFLTVLYVLIRASQKEDAISARTTPVRKPHLRKDYVSQKCQLYHFNKGLVRDGCNFSKNSGRYVSYPPGEC
jgi:hypothetical protein